MNSWKIRIALAAVSALSVVIAANVAQAQTYKPRDKRVVTEQGDPYYAPRAERYSNGSSYDYFFSNPSKYRGYRSNRGEYYPGAIRR